MPAKKSVRFALPRSRRVPHHIPGFSYSSSTMTSSAGPITPPHVAHPLPHHYPLYQAPHPLSYPKQPHYRQAVPANYRQPVSLHPLLMASHKDRLQWDLLNSMRSDHLIAPASSPPLPYIQIVIRMNVSPRHLRPFWLCRVHASSHYFVTVGDVLGSIFKCLRRNIAQSEFDALSEHDRSRTSRYYKKRYSRLEGYDNFLYSQEKSQGMKRIDFLVGHTRFEGLSPGHQPDEFLLNLS